MFAVWSDRSQPTRAPAETYALLIVYSAWASALTMLTWRNWWLDARLAVPAHVIDIIVFMVMLYSTEGYTSPYFTFFVFLLLSAAIRWGWRETASTAAIVIAIYLIAGLFMAPAGVFDAERFIVRTGHLLILSAILIWFASNQRAAWGQTEATSAPVEIGGEPLVSALRVGMRSVRAGRGALLWRDSGGVEASLTVLGTSGVHRIAVAPSTASVSTPLLYDVDNQRALSRSEQGRWQYHKGDPALPVEVTEVAGLTEGLAVPVAAPNGNGTAYLERVHNLSIDHLAIARRIGTEIAAHLQAAAVIAAAETASVGKARDAVARDLHDSVVQFLASLGYRIEALARSGDAGERTVATLTELSQQVLSEQDELRAFIGALRTGSPVTSQDLIREIGELCERLSRQWTIECQCAIAISGDSVPVALQLELQHLIREAVANAARHGGATRVRVRLNDDDRHLCLEVEDNGRGFRADSKGQLDVPVSLAGRVRESAGRIEVRSVPGQTSVTIRLPKQDEP